MCGVGKAERAEEKSYQVVLLSGCLKSRHHDNVPPEGIRGGTDNMTTFFESNNKILRMMTTILCSEHY
jgi:hypothetical protein